jgi:hypothetical protein
MTLRDSIIFLVRSAILIKHQLFFNFWLHIFVILLNHFYYSAQPFYKTQSFLVAIVLSHSCHTAQQFVAIFLSHFMILLQ